MRALAACGLAAVIACGGSDERTLRLIRVAPAADPGCGAAEDGLTMLVTARGDFPPTGTTTAPVDLAGDGAIRIDSFPTATRVLELEVLGPGGVVERVGRTAPFDIEALEDGAELPVFMAPERGFCPTGNETGIARDRPLAARAGAGVLIAGGTDLVDEVNAVQLYDPATGGFDLLAEPLYQGLIGASMTTADDGRVLVAGGGAQAYQVYHPDTGVLDPAAFLPAEHARAFHAAVALPGGRVLLAGGCSALDADDACQAGSALTTTSVVDLVDEEVTEGPPLARPRIGGVALADADGRVLLVGGVDEAGAPVTIAERIDPGFALGAEEIVGAGGLGVRLASGAALVSLATGGAPAGSEAVMVPPGGTTAVATLPAPVARDGASLTVLDDGRVLVLGGVDGVDEAPLLWDPDEGRFEAVDILPIGEAWPLARRGHAAVLLDDGSVLMVGGHQADPPDDVAPLGDAWIFRPDLIGAYTGDVTLGFGATDTLAVVPSDPSRVRREAPPPRLVITAGGAGGALPADWIIVGGPRFSGLRLTARIRADAGAAVLLGFVDERDHAAVVLVPGQRPRLYRRIGADALIVDGCDGEVIAAGELSPTGPDPELIVETRGDSLGASLAGRAVLSCAGIEAIPRGAIGVGPVGTSGSELSVSSLSVTR